MKLGKVLTYKDIDEAEKLVGKKVVYSNCFKSINNFQDCRVIAIDLGPLILNEVREGAGLYYPFQLSDDTVVQFIREVIEDESDPHYEPYDLSDPKVRDSLRGRWYKVEDRDGTREEMVSRFLFPAFTKKWEINGWTVEGFLKYCHWIDDGTPCGRMMNREVR